MAENGKRILVIGGGIAGMTTALEAAEAGCEVVLVEQEHYLGGRVARMNQYFPKLCPPTCGLEINFRRIKMNPAVTVLTGARVEEVSGKTGAYEVKVNVQPRYVTEACTLCGECIAACPSERGDDFNYGLSKTKVAYLPHAMAFPALYAIDRKACAPGCTACRDACRYQAIDLDQKPVTESFSVSSVVVATGWKPYDAARIDNLGFGKYPNVVTNVLMERMAAPNGPTGGKIMRPSDGAAPESVVFVQCAGSRDENHLPYCSAVCCAASLKQTTYLRAQYPDAKITIFYIDVRTPGRLEEFHEKVVADDKLELIKGKAAKVEEDSTGALLVTAEDVMSGRKTTVKADLVVLAAGIVPNTDALPAGASLDDFGFLAGPPGGNGILGAGCVRRPEEVSATVQDATGTALKAFQIATRSANRG